MTASYNYRIQAQKWPSDEIRVVPPPLHLHLKKKTTPPSCRTAKTKSSGTTHAANVPLRQWRVGLRAFDYGVVLDFPVRFAEIDGLGRRRWKKAVQRHFHPGRVWDMRHPSTADLMEMVCFQPLSTFLLFAFYVFKFYFIFWDFHDFCFLTQVHSLCWKSWAGRISSFVLLLLLTT